MRCTFSKSTITSLIKISSATFLKMSTKVAICQFTSTNVKENNLNIVKSLVSNAVEEHVKIIFLPEGSDYIANNKNESAALCEPITGPLMSEYKKLAKQHKIWISVGGFHEKCGQNHMYNSHILIDAEGEIRGIYRKIHLFDVHLPDKDINLRESELITAGNQIISPIQTPAGNLALSICYDLRFPEISTIQTKLGADILTFPSAFTNKTGEAHWEVLLRARAIENQCYVIAAAQCGTHNENRISFGQSMIVDPWGKMLAQCPKYTDGDNTKGSIATAVIDLEYLKKVRTEMPIFQHRRNDIYNLNLVLNSKDIVDDEQYSFSDKIIPGSTVFYRSQYCYAFTNIRCVVSGHVLVATLRQTPRLKDLTQEEIADLFQTTIKISKALETIHNANSSTICVQDGVYAGQTIPHVHVHILPRKQGDFQRNDDIYLHLSKHDKEDSPQRIRPVEEMSEEAQTLRTYFC